MRFVSSSRLASLASLALALPLAAVTTGCADPKQQALDGTKNVVTEELTALHQAALDIQAAAPAADADGWNADDDGAAVDDMRAAWKQARISYERVEGAIAVLFPDLDAATDERYDGFIAEGADDDMFDGEGATGVHAIERIIFSDQIPANVVEFESALPNYTVAAFPATEAEAAAFKTELTQRLVDDTQTMIDGFAGVNLDTATAYRGVIGSMAEQVEKVALAGSGEDESRYAQSTLLDMRANLEGGREIFEQFGAMFTEKGADGEATKTAILARLDAVKAKYDAIEGDAIPAVPEGWNPDEPSAEDLATPYGELFTFLEGETNIDDAESLVSRMGSGGDLLGIEALPE